MLRFGTDGVRGVANTELTPELAVSLGRAAARVIGGDQWLVGRDTRRSGPQLGAALAAGLASEGASVTDLDVLPTPGVAHLSAVDGVPAAMISASHNSFADNGIKLFAPGGHKLTDAVEEALEAELDRLTGAGIPGSAERPVGREVGALHHDPAGWHRYAEHLEIAALAGRRLDGVKVVVDAANGAAFQVAPRVLAELGATVTVIHAEPDGTNINQGCGSTDPADLRRAVVEGGADAGLAFDGDADRVIAVDGDGALVDGDGIIAVCAVDLHERGRLARGTVVVTVMSNLGFRLAMRDRGIDVVDTQVGDRYVLEALQAGGYNLGGEQSGHVIFADRATTGDGLLTGLCLLDVMARTGRPLSHLAAIMERLPQVLRNIEVASRPPDLADRIAGTVGAVEAELGDRGRVLVRPSGTEPVVRVMVEASTAETAGAAADRLVGAVERATRW